MRGPGGFGAHGPTGPMPSHGTIPPHGFWEPTVMQVVKQKEMESPGQGGFGPHGQESTQLHEPMPSHGPTGPMSSHGPTGPMSSHGPSGPIPSHGPTGPMSSHGPTGPMSSHGPNPPHGLWEPTVMKVLKEKEKEQHGPGEFEPHGPDPHRRHEENIVCCQIV